jgi:hypothetical protein
MGKQNKFLVANDRASEFQFSVQFSRLVCTQDGLHCREETRAILHKGRENKFKSRILILRQDVKSLRGSLKARLNCFDANAGHAVVSDTEICMCHPM